MELLTATRYRLLLHSHPTAALKQHKPTFWWNKHRLVHGFCRLIPPHPNTNQAKILGSKSGKVVNLMKEECGSL
jgi:hypothetical protein